MTRLPLALVVHEILPKVPAKTVARCKCVSKECYAMISAALFGPLMFASLCDCISFLELLGNAGYVQKFMASLEDPFEKMLLHFHKHVKESSFTGIPTNMSNGTKITYINMYLSMEAEGGYYKSFSQQRWQGIATNLGYPTDSARELRDLYHKYIAPIVVVHENTSHQRPSPMQKNKRKLTSARRDFPAGCGPLSQK